MAVMNKPMPGLAVTSFSTLEEALQLASSTNYGFFARVWGSDLSAGIKVAKSIHSGVAMHAAGPVGEGAGSALSIEPYGQSGIGVESGLSGLETYQRRQVLWFDHG